MRDDKPKYPSITMDLRAPESETRIVAEIADDASARLTIDDCSDYFKRLREVIDGSLRETIKTDDGDVIEFGREASKITISIKGRGSLCELTSHRAKDHAGQIEKAAEDALAHCRR